MTMARCKHLNTMCKMDLGGQIGPTWCVDCLAFRQRELPKGKGARWRGRDTTTWFPAHGDRWRVMTARAGMRYHYRLRPTGLTDERGRQVHVLGQIWDDGKKNLCGTAQDMRDFADWRAGVWVEGKGVEATREAVNVRMDRMFKARLEMYGAPSGQRRRVKRTGKVHSSRNKGRG